MGKKWKKLTNQEMNKIHGGGFWLTVWGLSLATAIVAKSLFSPKAAVAINGVGRASWNDEKISSKNMFAKGKEKAINFQHLENFVEKFYEI